MTEMGPAARDAGLAHRAKVVPARFPPPQRLPGSPAGSWQMLSAAKCGGTTTAEDNSLSPETVPRHFLTCRQLIRKTHYVL